MQLTFGDAEGLDQGLSLRAGAIVHAPSSTKNADKARDPEMHQTKMGNHGHFSMKRPTGVDELSGLMHNATRTAANASGVTVTQELLRGKKDSVLGDSGVYRCRLSARD